MLKKIIVAMWQSPSRGTGISTVSKIAREIGFDKMWQSPSRGTGISTLLSQDALPERLSEVEIYRDCTFLYFLSKVTGYFVKI